MHYRKQDLQYWCDTKADERVNIHSSSKKGDLLECGNYRLISLMSHITKIIVRIIMRRVRNKLLPEISEEQFGFKKDCGTRDAIFVLRIRGERSIEMQRDIHIAFIDYEKVFDRMKHEILMKDLKLLGIDEIFGY